MLDNSWTISDFLFDYLFKLIPVGATILELGSGHGTEELVKYWKVFSIEQSEKWLNLIPGTNYIYAPLKKHKPVRNHEGDLWYDAKILEERIPKLKYDLILVDGPAPPGCRAGLIKYFNIFDSSVPIIFDDINRDKDWRVIKSMQNMTKRSITIPYKEGVKMFGVLK